MNNKILILALVIALIAVAATLYITTTESESTDVSKEGIVVNNDADAPSSPMDLVLSSTPFSADKVATMSVKIGKRRGYPTKGANWPGTIAEIVLPEGLELVEGNLTWQGDIIGDDIVEFAGKVKAIRNGEWKVEAYAKCVINESNWVGDRESFYILVTEDKVLIGEKPFTPVSPEERSEQVQQGEYMPLDGYLSVENPAIGKNDWSPLSYYPPEYGVLVGKDYRITFTTISRSSPNMSINVPKSNFLVSRISNESSQEKHMLSIVAQVTQPGRYIITGIASIDRPYDEPFQIVRELILYAGETLESIRELRSQYIEEEQETESIKPLKVED